MTIDSESRALGLVTTVSNPTTSASRAVIPPPGPEQQPQECIESRDSTHPDDACHDPEGSHMSAVEFIVSACARSAVLS